MRIRRIVFVALIALSTLVPAGAEPPVNLKHSRRALEPLWRARIQSILNKNVIPLIDLESSINREDGEYYLSEGLAAMDDLGVALIAFDSSKKGRKKKYDWVYFAHELVNAHPDRFVLASNGGSNRNWVKKRGGKPTDYIDQLERHVRGGDYPLMGEIEFRHYMSGRQCKSGKTSRDVDVPLNGENGQRVFRLSAETGVPFVIHLEPEDAPLEALEEMLAAYPKARVIAAHFGQIRHPARQSRFGPKLVRRLLGTYPNLFYDISTGQPGRQYKCGDNVLDTVIWEAGSFSGQKDTLKPEYKSILTEFSDRFVVGLDYGGGRGSLEKFMTKKVNNARLIMRDLPERAKHNIGYRNAWRLLTGRAWNDAGARKTPPAKMRAPRAALLPAEKVVPYKGVISDGHAHFANKNYGPELIIEAMARNNVDKVVIFAKSKGENKDGDVLAFKEAHPGRVIAAAGFQNQGWRSQSGEFIETVREKAASGDFKWLGEAAFRGKIGGLLHAPPDGARWREVMNISAEKGLPVTIHHNPYIADGGVFKRTDEYERMIESFAHNPKAIIVWAHWCGLSKAEDVRKMLERFPNLHCDLAWLSKGGRSVPNPIVGKGSRFLPEWKKLIEDFPGRFIAGIDLDGRPEKMENYDRRVKKLRRALGSLSSAAARKVATENFHRLVKAGRN